MINFNLAKIKEIRTMKKILYIILEQWADWELAYISSAVNMLGQGRFENKTVSLDEFKEIAAKA